MFVQMLFSFFKDLVWKFPPDAGGNSRKTMDKTKASNSCRVPCNPFCIQLQFKYSEGASSSWKLEKIKRFGNGIAFQTYVGANK